MSNEISFHALLMQTQFMSVQVFDSCVGANLSYSILFDVGISYLYFKRHTVRVV